MKKVYEIALLYGGFDYENVKTYEYATMEEMQNDLKEILKREDKALFKIEISILEQDQNGENEKVYTFCDINIQELLRGERVCKTY